MYRPYPLVVAPVSWIVVVFDGDVVGAVCARVVNIETPE